MAIGTMVAALAFAVPLAATADPGKGKNAPPPPLAGPASYVAPGLVDRAKNDPGQKLRVIIQGADRVGGAEGAFVNDGGGNGGGGKLRKELNLVGAVAVDIPAGKLEALSKRPALIITPDSPVKLSGTITYSKQLWPYESGAAQLWGTSARPAPGAPTIAIVDSGVDTSRADFAGHVYPQVTLTGLPGNSPGDGRGHGTFVAGIAAGSAPGYAGAAPNANILPIDVMDDNGMALTSDVINACQWILDNKDAFNIRVANFSLHSSQPGHFMKDPLDRAVEKLWLNGVTVVAAAGNYGTAGQPVHMGFAPGNDPFVITVGAADLGGTVGLRDDSVAPWSAYGYTYDGFAKPDIVAGGRFMIGPVSPGATLATQRPDHIVAPGYMQLSGTSFSAPIVSGAAAQILARHPSWGPDQVKCALMSTARSVPNVPLISVGSGEVNAGKAAAQQNPPNPNKALEGFLVADPAGGSTPVFDTGTWESTVKSSASWDSASWNDASWNDASWNDAVVERHLLGGCGGGRRERDSRRLHVALGRCSSHRLGPGPRSADRQRGSELHDADRAASVATCGTRGRRRRLRPAGGALVASDVSQYRKGGISGARLGRRLRFGWPARHLFHSFRVLRLASSGEG